MSSIIIPGKWDRQPPYLTEPDPNNPFGAHCVAVFITTAAGGWYWERGKGWKKAEAYNFTESAPTATPYGLATSFPADSATFRINNGDSTLLAGATELSVVGRAYGGASTNNYGYIFYRGNAASNSPFGLEMQANGSVKSQIHNTGYSELAGATASDLAWNTYGMRWKSGETNGWRLFLNGKMDAQATKTDTISSTAYAIFVGANTKGLIPYAALYDKAFSDAEMQFLSIDANFYGTLRKRPQVLYFDVGGGGGITGTGAATTAATTASGTGTLTHKGTGALTTGATTASGTGVISHTGTGAITTLAATLAGAGVVTHFGTGDLTIAAVTVAGEGTVTQAGAVTGTGALTISAITASGTGTLSHTGTGSLQTSVVTLDGAGVLTHTGTGDLTTGATTLAGEGSTLGTITGTGALTIGAVTVSGYDVLPSAVVGGGIGHGGFARKAKRFVKVEEAETPEQVIAEIESSFAEAQKKRGRKPKNVAVVPKPVETQEFDVNAWLDYYQQQVRALREQEAANDLIARAKLRIQQLQEQETLRRLEEYQAMLQMQQEEEELLLLLMAA